MANTLLLKRSAVAAKVPTTANLSLGELGINTADGRLFTKRNNGTDYITEFLNTDSAMKPNVRAATTANITLSAAQTIDGVACVAGDRVLVKNQSTASANGIYVVAAGAWTRTHDADTAAKLAGAMVAVSEGTTNGGRTFDTDWKATDTLGTTNMTWSRLLDLAAIGVDVQAYDADLDAIAALAGTSGFLKKTAANTWSLDTATYANLASANTFTDNITIDKSAATAQFLLNSTGGSGRSFGIRSTTAGALQIFDNTGSTTIMTILSSGAVGISGANSNTSLAVGRNITSDGVGGVSGNGVSVVATIQSDVTSVGAGFTTGLATAVATFTLSNLRHYQATQGTIGAGSSVTTQVGFYAAPTLIGATTNVGFQAISPNAHSQTYYGFNSTVAINGGGGTNYALYFSGTAWSYFAAPVVYGDVVWRYSPAPTSKAAAATLTAAEVKTGILLASGTSYTITLPTGANLDAGFSGLPSLTTNTGFDWQVISSASGAITIAGNTGVTVTGGGSMNVGAGNSVRFHLRRTGSATYQVYRLS